MKLILYNIFVYSFSLFLLASFSISGYTDVICLGDNGHIELETICIPSCADSDQPSYIETPTNHHEDHAACSDVEIDTHLWSKRTQKSDSKLSEIKICTLFPTIPNTQSVINPNNNNKLFSIVLPKQNTPLVALSTVILIC